MISRGVDGLCIAGHGGFFFLVEAKGRGSTVLCEDCSLAGSFIDGDETKDRNSSFQKYSSPVSSHVDSVFCE